MLQNVLLPAQRLDVGRQGSRLCMEDAAKFVCHLANGGTALLSALPYLTTASDRLGQQPAAGLHEVPPELPGRLASSLIARAAQAAGKCAAIVAGMPRSADQLTPDLAAPQAALFSFNTEFCRLLSSLDALPSSPHPKALSTMFSCLSFTAVTLERLVSGVGQLRASRWACCNAG